MPTDSAIRRLAGLLRDAGAEPVVHPKRLGASPIYDLHYRVVIVTCAFLLHAKRYVGGTPLHAAVHLAPPMRISARRLKLLQFVAIRPWLLPVVQEWSRDRDAQGALLPPQAVRRGFIGDVFHDGVVEYLTVAGVLRRDESFVVVAQHAGLMAELWRQVETTGLFTEERRLLEELRLVRITNKMLEGW